MADEVTIRYQFIDFSESTDLDFAELGWSCKGFAKMDAIATDSTEHNCHRLGMLGRLGPG